MRQTYDQTDFGDRRTRPTNRATGAEIFRTLQSNCREFKRRGPTECVADGAGVRMKMSGSRHLTGMDVFWTGIWPKTHDAFLRRNAAGAGTGYWLFVTTAADGRSWQCWL